MYEKFKIILFLWGMGIPGITFSGVLGRGGTGAPGTENALNAGFDIRGVSQVSNNIADLVTQTSFLTLVAVWAVISIGVMFVSGKSAVAIMSVVLSVVMIVVFTGSGIDLTDLFNQMIDPSDIWGAVL